MASLADDVVIGLVEQKVNEEISCLLLKENEEESDTEEKMNTISGDSSSCDSEELTKIQCSSLSNGSPPPDTLISTWTMEKKEILSILHKPISAEQSGTPGRSILKTPTTTAVCIIFCLFLITSFVFS